MHHAMAGLEYPSCGVRAIVNGHSSHAELLVLSLALKFGASHVGPKLNQGA